jgi:FkbM family methyltransferase
MKPWSGLGTRIVMAIEARQQRLRLCDPTALGEFYRSGGNALLYDRLPVSDTDVVMDVGGYHGDWTAGMLARYGCHSELFEPTPAFVGICMSLFAANKRVRIQATALGASHRRLQFTEAASGTSAFQAGERSARFEAQMVDVSEVLRELRQHYKLPDERGAIGCLKLNIEGGEYEVLEALINRGEIGSFRCLLIQFHRQPVGFLRRHQAIAQGLSLTHTCRWAFSMVWERWDLRNV